MYRSLFALLAILASSAALACVPPPPIVQLPGESIQAYHERVDAAFAAELFEQRRVVQSNLLAQANAVFIGVVADSREIDVSAVKGHEVSVRPVYAIKGDLPKQPVTLRDTVFTDCGMSGGGSATSAQAGDYVIVFAGVPTSAFQGTNVGILAKESGLSELRGALAHYGLVSSQRK